MKLTFDKQSFQLNGKDTFMVSGEFHYFRVPHTDWKPRMDLFKEAGGNVIATYVPWCIHEPQEGTILFGDCPQRDLAAFLETAREAGLGVIVRPGPYQYSELINDGLPEWLVRDYPEIRAARPDGSSFRYSSVSYLHPTFLEKARAYYKAFADVVRPYIEDPIVMLQVDNEATGIHFWFGSIDYNPVTMGFGQENGRYPRYLQHRYASISDLNQAYGTSYTSFTDIPAPDHLNRRKPEDCRCLRDYYHFYYETIGEYLTLLRSWLQEDGLHVSVCHNAAGPSDVARFHRTVEMMGEDFLLGSDHYYTLGQNWSQNNPTPQHIIRAFSSLERMRLLGMPPSVLEMPGGSPSDTPPILWEDLLAWYRANIAFGMKGVNYYVYTGGPNFPGSGATCDVYDYNAIIHADGSMNETYRALKDVGIFMKDNSWLQRAQRKTSVAVGFTWEHVCAWDFEYQDVAVSTASAANFQEKGILHTLLCSRYAPELTALDGELDLSKPLIIASASCMEDKVQQKLVDFVKMGGKLILFGGMPQYHTDFTPCSILKDFCGVAQLGSGISTDKPITLYDGSNMYQMNRVQTLPVVPEGCSSMGTDTMSGHSVGFRKDCGGTLIWMGVQWNMNLFVQAEMLENMLADLGAQPVAESSNRNLFTSVLESPDGRRMLFIMNLYSGAQHTDITVYRDGQPYRLEHFILKPMEVRWLEI